MKWLALTLMIASASAAGADTRALKDRTDQFGWEAVGRVETGPRSYCSGSLISPTLVLTAAHCVFDENNVRRDPTQMEFRAGYRDGNTIAIGKVARAAVLSGFDPDDKNFEKFLANDVALLELTEPIPGTTASYFPIAGIPREGTRVTAVSYGKGRDNAATRQSGCSVLIRVRGLAAFSCKGDPGSSGAPIFDTSGRSPQIVGLISSTGPFEGRDAVFGMDLPSAVKRLQRAFRTGNGAWPEQAPASARRIGSVGGKSAGNARFIKPE